MYLNQLLKHLKKYNFLNKQRRMVKKWYADGGDYYFRFNYKLDDQSIVLDIGGYDGQWASDLFSMYKCKIFIFEPVNAFAEKISKRFRQNDQIEVFNFGLGGFSRPEIIHLSDSGSSIFGHSKDCEKIVIVDIKDWLDQKKVDKISLMKINIEGCEYELLERLIDTKLISKIENIQIQFHNISKDSRIKMRNIQDELIKTHKLTYQYLFVWENWTLN